MRVLLVEDEPKMCELLREGLTGQGHVVTSALDGLEALLFATEFQFDAMILDRMLPYLDGTEVARRIRSAGTATPILMLTARDSVSDVVQGLDSGVDDYLAKPFSLAELYARVRALGRRTPVLSSSVLRFADLELDMDKELGVCFGDLGTVSRLGQDNSMTIKLDSGRTAEVSSDKSRHIDYGYTVENLKRDRAERVIATGDGLTQQVFQTALQTAEITLYTGTQAPAQEVTAAKALSLPELAQPAQQQHDFGIGF